MLENGSICGEASYLRQKPARNAQSANDRYRYYWYWVHIDPKPGQKKSHYKGPVNVIYYKGKRKNRQDLLLRRRYNNPIPKRQQKDPKEFNEIIVSIFHNLGRREAEVKKNLLKFSRLLQIFPLSKPANIDIKKLQLEKKLPPYEYKWEPGVKENADRYLKNHIEIQEKHKRLIDITYHEYKNALFDYNHDKKLSEEEKGKIFLDKLKTFLLRCEVIRGYFNVWNDILSFVTDERSGESFLGWLKIIEYNLDGGNSSRNYVLTGEYVMRLVKNYNGDKYPLVEIVPVKREFTPRQIEDKIHDIANKYGLNYSRDGEFENLRYECKQGVVLFDSQKINYDGLDLESKIKIDKMTNQMRNELREEMDKKLLYQIRLLIESLEQNPLSQFVEIAFNNVLTEIRKSPKEFYKEQIRELYNKDVTEEEITGLRIREVAPEIMDREKVSRSYLHKQTYSMKQGRAARRNKLHPRLSEAPLGMEAVISKHAYFLFLNSFANSSYFCAKSSILDFCTSEVNCHFRSKFAIGLCPIDFK